MFIEIKEDVIKEAIIKKTQEFNESMDILIQMALCARLGKHIVSVPCFLNKTYCQEIIGLIGKSYFSALDYFNRKKSVYGSVIQNLSVRGVISYEALNSSETNAIWINPCRLKSFEPWIETHVLTENLVDSFFYTYLTHFFVENKVLNGRKGSLDFNFKFYPLMGGGVTIEKVLKGEIKREQHFCLAIADSDKKWSGDKVGDTAQKMIELMDKENPFNCNLYVMNKVREIENLIPKKFVEELGDKTGYIDIFNYDPSFFDMKIGLCLGELFHNETYEYWRDMLKESALFHERNEKIQLYPEKKKYDEKIKGCKPLKKGFGSNLLTLVIGDIDFEKGIKKFKPRLNDALFHVKQGELTESQQEEWNNIGQLMFSWTCCLKAKF